VYYCPSNAIGVPGSLVGRGLPVRSESNPSPEFSARPPTPLRRVLHPVQEFVGEEASGGVLLLLAACAALVWANAPGGSYEEFWTRAAHLDVGRVALHLDVREWVNDGLMAIFFFVVGMEIKRELLEGELNDRRRATLPIAAAFGGMIVPALIYSITNLGESSVRGWGIPMATDIAFALGLLSLLSKRVPVAMRAFLLALAIVDDIGGILVIALFYTDDVSSSWLAVSAGVFAAVAALSLLGFRVAVVYGVLGCVGWFAVHESGVHATIAGVALGLLLPVGYGGGSTSLIDQAEDVIHPWSSYVIVPLFALANAGIDLGGDAVPSALTSSVGLGVILGLVIGKPAGILLFSVVAVRLGIASLPNDSDWSHVAGIGLIAGIGFTVAIFISTLAFDQPTVVDGAKIGIVVASAVSAALGATWLLLVSQFRTSGRAPSA
jgi:Na+:H+ antiporter, NhaA family